jgi:5-(carboxyamino)imidazole ribonucleotide mutase
LPFEEDLLSIGRMKADEKSVLVSIILGSKSDWEVMKHAALQLQQLGIPWEGRALSAHRATDALIEYLKGLPDLGVPMESASLKGLDSLLSIAQMPAGVPVGTLAIGKAGAVNAALLAAAILGGKHPRYRQAYERFRSEQTAKVTEDPVLTLD